MKEWTGHHLDPVSDLESCFWIQICHQFNFKEKLEQSTYTYKNISSTDCGMDSETIFHFIVWKKKIMYGNFAF